MTELYQGQVKYEADEGEGQYGPYVRLAVVPDDADAPNQGNDGIIRIYKDPSDTAQVMYMKSLAVGDTVTLAWLQGKRGKKGSYSLSIPRGFKPESGDAQVSKGSGAQVSRDLSPKHSTPERQTTYSPLVNTPGARAVADDALDLMVYITGRVVERFPDYTPEDTRPIATTLFIQASRHANYVPDGALAQTSYGEDALDDETEFLLAVAGSDDKTAAVITALAGQFDLFGDEKTLKRDLKGLGLSSSDITDEPESWQRLWRIVRDYSALLDEGVSIAEARKMVWANKELFPDGEDGVPF